MPEPGRQGHSIAYIPIEKWPAHIEKAYEPKPNSWPNWDDLPVRPVPPQLVLNEDEEALITAYRRFKNRNWPGSTFGWQSPIDTELVLPPYEPVLIEDPREVKVL